jgi:hypothetical protein
MCASTGALLNEMAPTCPPQPALLVHMLYAMHATLPPCHNAGASLTQHAGLFDWCCEHY